MNNQDIAKHSAAMLDLFEAEQQRILLLDPKERAMQHNYQKTMAVCYELRTFIRSIDAKPSAVLEAAPASSAMAQAVDAVTVPRELFDELIDMAQDEASAYHLSHKGYKPEQHAQRDKVIAAARSILESQQSPVQASDAGSQG